MAGRGQGWFVVLPDCDAALAAAAHFADAPRTVPHASGRPWLMGSWELDELRLTQDGVRREAMFGVTAGSYHLVTSIDGRIRCQGTLSGLRQVFWAECDGVVVASDRVGPLARAVGAVIDERLLAVRLLAPVVPHPLTERSVYRGIHPVPSGDFLVVERNGTARTQRWWTPPEPGLPISHGAARVAEALVAAVEARTSGGGTISADLSGGFDSTTLCFLAARGPAKLITTTTAGLEAEHDDAEWALRAAEHLDAEHLLYQCSELPPFFDDLAHGGYGMDEPHVGMHMRARFAEIGRRMAARGSRLHLSGDGGDQVLQAHTTYLHDTFRRSPLLAVRHWRGWRARTRWPSLPTLGAVLDRRDYADWLRDTAEDLSPQVVADRRPALGWQFRPALPLWASAEAREAVRDLLREAAGETEPLAAARAQHETLVEIRNCTQGLRQQAQLMAEAGVPLEFPFFDDHVIEACLAVRLHERTTPFAYKPLLVEAMRDHVPAQVLSRRTKADFSADLHAGLHAQRTQLADWLDRPILAELGLIDAERFRAAVLGLHPPRLAWTGLEATLACEAWLRSLPRSEALCG